MQLSVVIIGRSIVVAMFRLVCILILLAISFIAILYFFGAAFAGSFQSAIWLLVIFSVCAVVVAFILMLRWSFEQYYIEETEIVHHKGVFFRRENRIPLKNILSIEADQNVLGRLLRYGNIIVCRPLTKKDFSIKHVINPHMQVRILESAIGNHSPPVPQSGN